MRPVSIFGIGRNYADHATELGNAVVRDASKMVIFGKPARSLLPLGAGPIRLPKGAEVHHEVELGVYIGEDTKHVSAEDALKCVSGFCVALDMTARNWQNAAKEHGHPWLRAKGFDTSCAVGSLIEGVPADDLMLFLDFGS